VKPLPSEKGKYSYIDGEWVPIDFFDQAISSFKGLVTDRYSVIFEGRKKGGPAGHESALYTNIGEKLPQEFYNILENYNHLSPMVKNRYFDGGRNVEELIKYMKNPEKSGIVSGRKPSGACHFGHKLVVETLGFLQRNGHQIYVPIADLEASLDPKISKKEQYEYFTADNLVDWGACNLDLEAAHVYPQSEEIRVLNLAYKLARNLDADMYMDIYGADTMIDQFGFIFAGLTQVGDILLPQDEDFGKEHSIMVSGPDQDGHMKMTVKLSRRARDRGYINSIPSAFYIKGIPSLSGGKESASEPEVTIYLGPSRASYRYHKRKKKLSKIRKLSLDERIKDTYNKLEKFWYKNRNAVINGMEEKAKVFEELEGCDLTALGHIKRAYREILEAHKDKRKDVMAYAVSKYLEELDSNKTEEILNSLTHIADGGELENASKPEFWKTPLKAYVPEDKKKIESKWYKLIVNQAKELIP